MFGSEEPSLIKKPTFMSFGPTALRKYFFYLICEFSLQCVRYVSIHALLLMACYLMLRVTVLVPRFSCFATQTIFTQSHRILWRCPSATCGLFVRSIGPSINKWCFWLCDLVWPRHSYSIVHVKQWHFMLDCIHKAVGHKHWPHWLTNLSHGG